MKYCRDKVRAASGRCCGFLVGIVVSFLFGFGVAGADQLFKQGTPELKERAGQSNAGDFPHFTELVKILSPAVVNISVESNRGRADEDRDQPPSLPFFKKEPELPSASLGSGFILSEDGYIVTNNHVVDKSSKIVVRLMDDRAEYSAKLIGVDLKTDLALIKIEPKAKLQTVFVGDSDKLEVGEWVIAIGNQFQLGQTVTAGIVSALSRRVPTKSAGPYDQFIQTDASINPGSSGGPLFNTRGQVIGINTAIFSPGKNQFGGTGFNIGIGFAIPINLAKDIIGQLKSSGKVVRGLLGVVIQEVNSDVAKALGLGEPVGALVADVMKDTPAEQSGFRRRDVIVGFNGKEIRQHEDLPLMVASTPIGTEVKIDILRGNKRETLSARIGELKDEPKKKTQGEIKPDSLGLIVEELNDGLIKSLDISGAKKGMIISSVVPNSVADRSGLIRGDIIEEIDNQVVDKEDTYERLIKLLRKDTPVLFLVRRPEGTRYLIVKVES